MLSLILGIAIILFSLVSVWICIIRTPDNLQGWYGSMFAIISLGGLIGGVCLILSYFSII